MDTINKLKKYFNATEPAMGTTLMNAARALIFLGCIIIFVGYVVDFMDFYIHNAPPETYTSSQVLWFDQFAEFFGYFPVIGFAFIILGIINSAKQPTGDQL
jgi:uncharacterized membrane protein